MRVAHVQEDLLKIILSEFFRLGISGLWIMKAYNNGLHQDS